MALIKEQIDIGIKYRTRIGKAQKMNEETLMVYLVFIHKIFSINIVCD